jgi:hypothetical protein
LLAKVVNDNAPILDDRGALEFFASKLAPTKSFKPYIMAAFAQLIRLSALGKYR